MNDKTPIQSSDRTGGIRNIDHPYITHDELLLLHQYYAYVYEMHKTIHINLVGKFINNKRIIRTNGKMGNAYAYKKRERDTDVSHFPLPYDMIGAGGRKLATRWIFSFWYYLYSNFTLPLIFSNIVHRRASYEKIRHRSQEIVIGHWLA